MMKHYGIWELHKDGSARWAIDLNDTVFITTSKGHAMAQQLHWTNIDSPELEVREFES